MRIRIIIGNDRVFAGQRQLPWNAQVLEGPLRGAEIGLSTLNVDPAANRATVLAAVRAAVRAAAFEAGWLSPPPPPALFPEGATEDADIV